MYMYSWFPSSTPRCGVDQQYACDYLMSWFDWMILQMYSTQLCARLKMVCVMYIPLNVMLLHVFVGCLLTEV